MAIPRPTPAPAVWWGAAPVLPAADAEVREALVEAVIEVLPVTGVTVELPAEEIALLDKVALLDGHEGWVLTLIF
jgi:hypothetical protein